MSRPRDRAFASDNNAGAHPDILRALLEANTGHARAYGDDAYTARAQEALEACFGPGIASFFVYNGTAANVLGLQAITRPYHAVLCAESSHLNVDECGAPERFLGAKLISVSTPDGKLRPDDIRRHYRGIGVPHHSQLRAVSVTSSTELGTVYSLEELSALAAAAHERDLLLHLDGARIANAAASLGCSLRETTRDVGVDVLSFGGTKNGLLFGEVVVFFDPRLAAGFPFIRKQGMQLASKMRFIAAQFTALLTGELWRRNAEHANRMARLLAEELRGIPGLTITQPVQANAVFATLPPAAIPRIQETYYFYVWDEERSEVRLMASYDTTEEDVRELATRVREVLRSS